MNHAEASSGSAVQQAPFSLISNHLVVNMADNFDQSDIDRLESRLMQAVATNPRLKGVIFNLSEVFTTDPHDLQSLQALFQAIRLLGAHIGICGINPGLAVVIVRSNLEFGQQAIGSDIDDLLSKAT
jgi:anti-anti-sigma regulatory factor